MAETLYPYLTKSGSYVYVDRNKTVVIESMFDDAELMSNGFAIVGKKDDKGYIVKGIIDRHGNVVESINHLSVYRNFTSPTRNFYHTVDRVNQSWKFWRWRLFPGFPFSGTGSRVIGTEVYGDHNKVIELNSKTVLTDVVIYDSDLSSRRDEELTFEFDEVRNIFRIGGDLYHDDGTKLKRIRHHEDIPITGTDRCCRKPGSYQRIAEYVAEFLPEDMKNARFDSVRSTMKNDVYIIELKHDGKFFEGVLDINLKEWIIKPTKDMGIYTSADIDTFIFYHSPNGNRQDNKCGLFRNGKIIVEAKEYHDIRKDGLATVANSREHYYIDLKSGEKYKEE